MTDKTQLYRLKNNIRARKDNFVTVDGLLEYFYTIESDEGYSMADVEIFEKTYELVPDIEEIPDHQLN